MAYPVATKTKKVMIKTGNYSAKGYNKGKSGTGQSKKQHRTIARGKK